MALGKLRATARPRRHALRTLAVGLLVAGVTAPSLGARAGNWPCVLVEEPRAVPSGGAVKAHRLVCDVARAEREAKRDETLARCTRLTDEVDASGCSELVRRTFEMRERAMARRALQAGFSADEVARRLAVSPAALDGLEAELASREAAPAPEKQERQLAEMEQRQAEMLSALSASGRR